MRVGFLCIPPDAPGVLPGPLLICATLLYILELNLAFMGFSVHRCVFVGGPWLVSVDAFWLPSVRGLFIRRRVGCPGY